MTDDSSGCVGNEVVDSFIGFRTASASLWDEILASWFEGGASPCEGVRDPRLEADAILSSVAAALNVLIASDEPPLPILQRVKTWWTICVSPP